MLESGLIRALEGDQNEPEDIQTRTDHRLSGRLRVTCSETLAFGRLTSYLAEFRRLHPGITLDICIDNRVLSLSRREADIALRPVRPREGDLWGRKLADVAWGLYASQDYIRSRTAPSTDCHDLSAHDVIGWDDAAAEIQPKDWLSRRLSVETHVYRSNSLINQMTAAKAGVGIALLPCYLGDPDQSLVRLSGAVVPDLVGELWIVTHSDLKATARVRAFFDVVGEALRRDRDLFEARPGE